MKEIDIFFKTDYTKSRLKFSFHLSIENSKDGGADGDRTRDLRRDRPAF